MILNFHHVHYLSCHMKLIMEYVDDITTNKADNDTNNTTYNDNNNQYMIIKLSW